MHEGLRCFSEPLHPVVRVSFRLFWARSQIKVLCTSFTRKCVLAWASDGTLWLLLLALLAWGNKQHIILSMLHFDNKDFRNSGSAILNRGAVCILTSSCLQDKHHGSTKLAGEQNYSTEKETPMLSSGSLYFNICFDYDFSPGFCSLLFDPS